MMSFNNFRKKKMAILISTLMDDLRRRESATLWMQEVNKVAVRLQKHHQPLYMCDAMIKELQDDSEKYKNKPRRDPVTSKVNIWHRSKFNVCKALTSYATLCPNPCFQSGSAKFSKDYGVH